MNKIKRVHLCYDPNRSDVWALIVRESNMRIYRPSHSSRQRLSSVVFKAMFKPRFKMWPVVGTSGEIGWVAETG